MTAFAPSYWLQLLLLNGPLEIAINGMFKDRYEKYTIRNKHQNMWLKIRSQAGDNVRSLDLDSDPWCAPGVGVKFKISIKLLIYKYSGLEKQIS